MDRAGAYRDHAGKTSAAGANRMVCGKTCRMAEFVDMVKFIYNG